MKYGLLGVSLMVGPMARNAMMQRRNILVSYRMRNSRNQKRNTIETPPLKQ